MIFHRARLRETDFEDVEIEGRIEVIAKRAFAGEAVDPGDDAALR